VIYETINLVKKENGFYILVIIADGQVTSEKETINAIVEASNYPISIIVIGVGGSFYFIYYNI
jgi:E3 ubiquitin-protein ligase RGLG